MTEETCGGKLLSLSFGLSRFLEIFRRSNEALHYCHFTGVMKQSDTVCDAMCDAICDDVRDDARAEAKWPRKVAT